MTKSDKGSIYLKVVNPSYDDVSLHSGAQIGTFHSISESEQDDYAVIDKSVYNVNLQVSIPKSPVLPDPSGAELSMAQQQSLTELVTSFWDVFSQHAHDSGRTIKVTDKIRTTYDVPISQRAYRTSPALKAEIHRQTTQSKRCG